MDEQQVRALVRQAIARHLGPGPGPASASPSTPLPPPRPGGLPASPGALALDVSHARFHLVRAAGEVECLIEPAVACTHCGFCQTYGH